jgi:hypothetical protein
MAQFRALGQAHHRDDDLGPDLLHELATVREAVAGEVLAERSRQGGLARKRALTPARREIARRANRAMRTS